MILVVVTKAWLPIVFTPHIWVLEGKIPFQSAQLGFGSLKNFKITIFELIIFLSYIYGILFMSLAENIKKTGSFADMDRGKIHP
ncbi:MAG: hypothetical protein OEY93_03015 [Anaerolineae bacterium]|nr:hypothetical protein [Anaerolineae bacterium]